MRIQCFIQQLQNNMAKKDTTEQIVKKNIQNKNDAFGVTSGEQLVPRHYHNGIDSVQLTPYNSLFGFPMKIVSDATVKPNFTPSYGTHVYQVDYKSSTDHYVMWAYLFDVKNQVGIWRQITGSSGIASINANTNAAQVIQGSGTTSVNSSAGTTTISNTNSYLLYTVASKVETSTTSETTIFSYTLPANTIGTSRAVNIKFPVNIFATGGATNTLTFDIYFGGSSVKTIAIVPPGGSGGSVYGGLFEANIIANAATNSQFISLGVAVNSNQNIGTGAIAGGAADSATASVDTTSNQVIKVTVTSAVSTTNLTAEGVIVTLL